MPRHPFFLGENHPWRDLHRVSRGPRVLRRRGKSFGSSPGFPGGESSPGTRGGAKALPRENTLIVRCVDLDLNPWRGPYHIGLPGTRRRRRHYVFFSLLRASEKIRRKNSARLFFRGAPEATLRWHRRRSDLLGVPLPPFNSGTSRFVSEDRNLWKHSGALRKCAENFFFSKTLALEKNIFIFLQKP